MDTRSAILQLFDQAFRSPAWHGPNLWQSLKGVTAEQAAWRPAPGRHNIWELALHAAYWKYAARRRLEGGKRGGFALPGSNYFPRPQPGKGGERDWRADRSLLEREHQALRKAVEKTLARTVAPRVGRLLWGVAFHDVYHAGQVRLLRRLMA